MFIMRSNGPNGRKTYFCGAFPSACGKTSTAMIPGENIVGDDLAYLRVRDGRLHAANVERGIFGIIRDVNPDDDPLIWNVLTQPGDVIFSNVLKVDAEPRWLADGRDEPAGGVNFAGEWRPGTTDADGKAIPMAHPNARYTIRLDDLANLDPLWDDPAGVPVGGIIYGGRDSDTWVPVQQSFDWTHGVITMGASLESETTAATLGQQGVRAFQPMSNLDFVAIPLGKYVQNHLDVVARVEAPPAIFAANYFQKKDGKYLTGMHDKNVWLKWMERRVHGDADAIQTPTGFIPTYPDLKKLFNDVLGTDYAESAYVEQFSLRVPENLEKIARIEEIYRAKVAATPDALFDVLEQQRARLLDAQKRYGDIIAPAKFA